MKASGVPIGRNAMKASEGKLGRIFLVRLEPGDDGAQAIESFAAENGIHAAHVYILGGQGMAGIIAPDREGKPGLRLNSDAPRGGPAWEGAEAVVQELLGIELLRVKDPSSGRETLAKVASPKTRVMTRPAPQPEESGPGTIPVYLFNAEFN